MLRIIGNVKAWTNGEYDDGKMNFTGIIRHSNFMISSQISSAPTGFANNFNVKLHRPPLGLVRQTTKPFLQLNRIFSFFIVHTDAIRHVSLFIPLSHIVTNPKNSNFSRRMPAFCENRIYVFQRTQHASQNMIQKCTPLSWKNCEKYATAPH